MKKIINKQSGFTLIEVVLVLAIGALIILMALLAFNGAQRSRRNTARTDAAGQMVASLEQSAANNNGAYPANVAAAAFASNIKDPKTGSAPVDAVDTANPSKLVYIATAKCTSSTAIGAAGTNTGGYAIVYTQEGGPVVCKDNL